MYSLSKLYDEFNYVYTADYKKTVIYTNNGRAYYTLCTAIEMFEIVEKFSSCSEYIKIFFIFQFKRIEGYLSRQFIIRQKITIKNNCAISKDVENFGNYNSEFSIYKKEDQVTLAVRNDTIEAIDFEEQPLEKYDLLFSYSVTRFIRDLVILLLFVSLLLIRIYNIRQILICRFKMLCRKMCCRKTLLPTTNDIPTATSAPSAYMNKASVISSYPPASSNLPFHQYFDPNVYQSIGPAYQSTSQMPHYSIKPCFSESSLSMNGIPVGDQMKCPQCDKLCRNNLGLAQHLSKMHKN